MLALTESAGGSVTNKRRVLIKQSQRLLRREGSFSLVFLDMFNFIQSLPPSFPNFPGAARAAQKGKNHGEKKEEDTLKTTVCLMCDNPRRGVKSVEDGSVIKSIGRRLCI